MSSLPMLPSPSLPYSSQVWSKCHGATPHRAQKRRLHTWHSDCVTLPSASHSSATISSEQSGNMASQSAAHHRSNKSAGSAARQSSGSSAAAQDASGHRTAAVDSTLARTWPVRHARQKACAQARLPRWASEGAAMGSMQMLQVAYCPSAAAAIGDCYEH
jgi:hypothetical protein